jgi:hypothetical protein
MVKPTRFPRALLLAGVAAADGQRLPRKRPAAPYDTQGQAEDPHAAGEARFTVVSPSSMMSAGGEVDDRRRLVEWQGASREAEKELPQQRPAPATSWLARALNILLLQWQRGSAACDITLQQTPQDAAPRMRLAMSSTPATAPPIGPGLPWTEAPAERAQQRAAARAC